MTSKEAITSLTERTRIALKKMWVPSAVSPTIIREEVLDLRMKGFMRKEHNGVLTFTPLGLEVCTALFGDSQSALLSI